MKHSILALCIIALIVPAMAQTVSYSAPLDKAIWAIDISAPQGSSGTFVLTLDNGDSVYGTWSYHYTIPPAASMTATIGSGSESETFVSGPVGMQMEIWNGDNVTYARQLKLGFGQFKGIWNKVASTTIGASPIRSYTITSTSEISASQEVISYKEAINSLNPSTGLLNDKGLVSLLTGYSGLIVAVFLSLIYWLKFLFVDHLVLSVSLYMTGTMAYAINTSRDIFSFYKTWFRQQRAMFEFIASAFATTFQIVTQVAVVIGNAMGTIGTIAIAIIRALI